MRIAIIPARGGSVRIPHKNIRNFKGKPMMQWPIEAAQASGLFDQIVVSSDDFQIRRIACNLNCKVHSRPSDDGLAGTQEIAAQILELEGCQPPTEVCVIYPCSPMLNKKDLVIGMNRWVDSRMPFARSVLPDGSDAGCFYWGMAGPFVNRSPLEGRTQDVVMPANRFIDINTEADWQRAESMFDVLRKAP